MSLTSSMYTGVSGLLANANALNVVGNNLANVNTVGFKDGRSLFSTMLSTSIGNNSQIGDGVKIQAVQNLFTAGSYQSSTNVTDLAIQGDSFFAVKDPNATAPVNQNAALLTRAGAFSLDSNLDLVNPDGYQVLDTQGNPIKFSDNAAGIATANADIATANSSVAVIADYKTGATAIQTEAAKYVVGGANDAAALATAVNGLAGVTAADKAAATAISAAATAANTAAAAAVATPNAATLAAAQTAFNALNTLTNGTTFTTAGAPALLTAFQTPLNASNTTVNTASTTASAAVAADPGVVAANALLATANSVAFGKITSIDPSGLITYLGKDGITSCYYNASGQAGVVATAANAATAQRLAVVTVANPGGLENTSGTLFKPTTASGVPASAFSLASNTANGTSEKLLSNELEASNVDLGTELVNLITTQRAYSANSKTITTADQMTQEVLSLKQ